MWPEGAAGSWVQRKGGRGGCSGPGGAFGRDHGGPAPTLCTRRLPRRPPFVLYPPPSPRGQERGVGQYIVPIITQQKGPQRIHVAEASVGSRAPAASRGSAGRGRRLGPCNAALVWGKTSASATRTVRGPGSLVKTRAFVP